MSSDARRRSILLLAGLLLVVLVLALVRAWEFRVREQRAEPHILEAARSFGVDPALVKAVVWKESRFQSDAHGRAGELGLMQVGTLAAREWVRAERVDAFRSEFLLDPVRNTRAGTWYLAKLLRRYSAADQPEAFALADYNAGRSNVLRWARGPAATNAGAFLAAVDFPSTRAYVRSVLARRDRYRGPSPSPGR